MKLPPMRNTVKHVSPGREPLRTFNELATDLGLTPAQLRGHFSTSRLPSPEPEFSAHGRRPQSYYRPSEVHAWWARHQQLLQEGQ